MSSFLGTLLFTMITAALISYFLTPLSKKIAFNIGIIDEPHGRHINIKPVPSSGGIAIYLGFLAAVLCFVPVTRMVTGILVGSTFILILGFIDDLYEITPWFKLSGQIIAAFILIIYGVQIQFVTNPFGGLIYLGFWGIPLTVLWIVGVTNTLNLIDGLDGLAAGVATIAVTTFFFVSIQEGQTITALMAIALAGSTLGFLRYNFYPAEIFMGDAGAMFCGYILAAISVAGALKSAAAVTIVVPVLALGIPIFDTIFAIIRRLYHSQPIGKADQGHLHHRLLALGWDQRQAVLLVYVISMLLGLIALIINGTSSKNAFFLLFLVMCGLVAGAWKLGIFTVELPAEGGSLENNNINI